MNRFTQMLGAGVTALSITLTVPSQSDAALFGVDVDAEFGLDQKTMEFINGLAPQVREEVVKLLKQALPLIDSSVTAYLDKVDIILEKQINHMQCAAIGVGAALSDDLKGKLLGGSPQPVSKLEDDMKKTISGFKPDVKPHDMRLAYSDLIYRATFTSCQVSLAPETAKDVSAILENLRPRWMVWYRLDGSCGNIKACFTWEADHVKQTLLASDARDNEKANANARLATVKQPTTKPVGVFSRTFDPTDYEKALGELISIEDGVQLAAAKRKGDAHQLIKSAQEQLSAARSNMDSSPKGPFNPRLATYRRHPDCNPPTQALAQSKAVLSAVANIEASITSARTLDQSVSSTADQIGASAQALKDEAILQSGYARQAEFWLTAGIASLGFELPCGL
jgi:hypothetical protein